jgi:hypothetical protein
MADYSIEVSIPNQGPKGDNGGIPEAPEDGLHYARKDAGWAETIGLENDGSIAAVVQVRQGTAAELGAIVLNNGEIAVELESSVPKRFRVGDGTTLGGLVPNVNNWNIVNGTSADNQIVANSTTLEPIDLFENIPALEIGGLYAYFGVATFLIDGVGGAKVTTGSVDSPFSGATVTIRGGEWPSDYVDWVTVTGELYDGSTGTINFSGFAKIAEGESRFRLSFAQETATDGLVEFLGYASYFAYQQIA